MRPGSSNFGSRFCSSTEVEREELHVAAVASSGLVARKMTDEGCWKAAAWSSQLGTVRHQQREGKGKELGVGAHRLHRGTPTRGSAME